MTADIDLSSVRVLYVETSYDGTIGGSHVSLLHLVTGMKSRGLSPVTVFASSHGLMNRFNGLGIKTIVVSPFTPLRANRAVTRPFLRLFNVLSLHLHRLLSIVEFRSIMAKEGVRLVHLNNSLAAYEWLLAAKLRRLPCVTHERALETRYSWRTRFMAKYFDAIICISVAVRNNLVAQGFRDENLCMIHNGLDASAFRPRRSVENVREEFAIARTRPIIGIVGNIQRWKGQDVLIRAIASIRQRVQNLICLIVGDVSTQFPQDVAFRDSLDNLIAEHGLEANVILTGYRSDVATYMNSMDIVVHASVEPEPFGRVLLEAMALRKPVIATRAGGVPEIVEDGVTGLLYTPGDSAQLARLIEGLLADADRRLAMGQAAFHRLMSEFNVEANTARTWELYQAVLTRSA